MTDLKAIYSGLATEIRSQVSGLTVYPKRPPSIIAPAMIFTLERIDYDTSRGTDDLMILGTLFTAYTSDQNEFALYDYMQADGDLSIKAACERIDETLGGVAEWTVVQAVRGPGIATYGAGTYYAAAFEIMVGTQQ